MFGSDSSHRLRSLEQAEAELAAVKSELQRRERAWQHQLEIAASVHHSLLPAPLRHPRIEIDTRYAPADTVGGDYCQVLFPDDSYCYVTMSDATGHGVGAALLATRVSSEVRRLVLERLSPAVIVERLNAFVVEHFCDTNLLLGFFAARVDLETGRLTYSGAGHPGALLIRRQPESVESLYSQNLLIGADDQCLRERPEDNRKLESGDRLVFFTDGLTETCNSNGQMLGTEGLVRMATITCAGKLFEVADCILERLAAYRSGPPQDDVTLIIAELK